METDPGAGAQRSACLCIHDPVAGGSFWHTRFPVVCSMYGIKELKPGRKEVDSYFCKKGIHLYPEELARIEHDFNNMPICLYLLENPLLNSSRGYCRIVREQCLEDLFSWIEVDYFRTFRLDEQHALVNLSCFRAADRGTCLDDP